MKPKIIFQKYHSWLIPLIFTIIYSVFLLIWLRIENGTPSSESGQNLYESIIFGRLWTNFLDGKVSVGLLLANYFNNFPAQNFVVFIFYLLFGVSSDIAISANIIWIFVLSYSVYNLLNRFYGRKIAVSSLFLLFSLPYIIIHTHELQKYLPTVAWLIFIIHLLYAHKAEENKKNAILFGLALGVGLLIDRLFIIADLVAIIIVADRIRLKEKRYNIINLLVTPILSMLLLATPWYAANCQKIFNGLGYIYHDWSNINIIVLMWPILVILLIALFGKFIDKKKIIKYLLPSLIGVFVLINLIQFLRISKEPLCDVSRIIDYIPYASTVQMVGDNKDDLDYSLGYYSEKAGVSWIKSSENASQADYWVIIIDKSADSRQNLFDYYDKGAVVANIDCLDSSFMVILKNENK